MYCFGLQLSIVSAGATSGSGSCMPSEWRCPRRTPAVECERQGGRGRGGLLEGSSGEVPVRNSVSGAVLTSY